MILNEGGGVTMKNLFVFLASLGLGFGLLSLFVGCIFLAFKLPCASHWIESGIYCGIFVIIVTIIASALHITM